MARQTTNVTQNSGAAGQTDAGAAGAQQAPGGRTRQSTLAARSASLTRKLPVSSANLMLAGLFAAGVMCLYLLNLRIGPKTASAEELAVTAQVDAAIQQLNASDRKTADDTNNVVNTFYYEAKERQVPVADLPGNPFVFKAMGGAANLAGGDAGSGGSDGPGTDQLGAVSAVRKLKLQSVLKGEHGAVAMISGDLLTEGQQITGWTVREIATRQVVLVRGGMEYVLQMPK
jgi:hypothetical protein